MTTSPSPLIALAERLEAEAGRSSWPQNSSTTYALKRDIRQTSIALRRAAEENAELKQDVIAFCAPWAVTYARDMGYPEGHLHPTHYDILERCGARLVDFRRAAEIISRRGGGGE